MIIISSSLLILSALGEDTLLPGSILLMKAQLPPPQSSFSNLCRTDSLNYPKPAMHFPFSASTTILCACHRLSFLYLVYSNYSVLAVIKCHLISEVFPVSANNFV